MKAITAGMTGAEFLNILNNFNGTQKVISDQVSADYSSLNTAITGIGTVKTFRIESAIVLTAGISFPSGVTLIIGSQGSISGEFTLTGNNTTIKFEGKNVAIGSDITFAGTWNSDEVDIYNFNVVADGVENDNTAIQKAFNFVNLTPHKRIKINGTFKISYVLIGNAKIIGYPKFIGTTGSCALDARGICGTFYNLDSNALINATSVVCSNATFLASIKEGDLINITSSLEFADSCNQGEIFEITFINASTIHFKHPLHDTYLTSNTAKIARIEPCTSSNEGMISIEFPVDTTGDLEVDKATFGLQVYYGKNNSFNVSCLKTSSRGVILLYCYKPRVIYRGSQGECAGYGYGVSIAAATMYADVTGSAHGYRHCIQHGGSTNGVPWESNVHDFNAVGVLSTGSSVYDTHASTGSVVFSNCIASSDGTLNSNYVGFTLNGRNTKLINCEARNVYVGAEITDPTAKNVSIKNFRCVDVHISFLTSVYVYVDYLEINGISHVNTALLSASSIQLVQGEIRNLHIENITTHNVSKVLDLGVITNLPATVVLKNISATSDVDTEGIALHIDNIGITNLVVDGLYVKNFNMILEIMHNITSCIVRNFHIENPSNVDLIVCRGTVSVVDINNGSVLNPVTANSCVVSLLEGVTTLKVSNVLGNGANLDHITKVPAGKTFTNFFHNGNIIVNALEAVHEDQTPTNTIIDGSIGM